MIADVRTIVRELTRGRMIVLVDDEARENEGDLLMAAAFVEARDVNFMARHGRGLVCVTLTDDHCRRLNLPMMTAGRENGAAFGTNFTVSVEAARGVSTGISAQDRATTIRAAANPAAGPDDLVSPGHVFPLRAEPGGVLVRAGHTEAGCDLTQMAGLFPAAVICEIMNEDGTMARMPELLAFAKTHKLRVGTIKSLIEHRLRHENLVTREYETTARTLCGEFRVRVYRDAIGRRAHLALARGEIVADRVTTVRVAIRPTVLDGLLLGAEGAAPAWSALPALERLGGEEAGILLLLAVDEEGGGAEKIGRQLGMTPAVPAAPGGRLRHYGIGAQILRDMGAGRIRLLSGQMRLPSMAAFGLTVTEMVER